MGTFEFGECSICNQNNKTKTMVLNYKFDSNITNNIVSFLGCSLCLRMKGYEDIYNNEKFNKLSKIQKQIHCLFSFFDNDYKKLKNLRDKKKFLKEIIDRSNCQMKPLVKKFLSDSQNIRMIESYKWFFLDDSLKMFKILNGEELEWDIITFRTISEPLEYVFKIFLECYLEHLMGWFRKYFNDIAISFHIMNN